MDGLHILIPEIVQRIFLEYEAEDVNIVRIALTIDEGARLLLNYHRSEWSTSRARARVDRRD